MLIHIRLAHAEMLVTLEQVLYILEKYFNMAYFLEKSLKFNLT